MTRIKSASQFGFGLVFYFYFLNRKGSYIIMAPFKDVFGIYLRLNQKPVTGSSGGCLESQGDTTLFSSHLQVLFKTRKTTNFLQNVFKHCDSTKPSIQSTPSLRLYFKLILSQMYPNLRSSAQLCRCSKQSAASCN